MLPRGGRGESTGHVNPKYGSEPGTAVLYPYLRPVRAVQHPRGECRRVRDSTYVLDLLYHESGPGSRSTTPDTAGFTDHAVRPDAPARLPAARRRIRDLGETKLYAPPQGRASFIPTLRPLTAGTLNIANVRAHRDDTSAPGQLDRAGHRHRLADAAQARQLPAPERTGRGPARAGPDRAHAVHPRTAAKYNCAAAHAGLNKGEARNFGAGQAVFFSTALW